MIEVSKTTGKPKQKLRGIAAIGAGPGRPKGLPNKATVEFKAAVNNLLNFAAPEMVGWLKSVADGLPEHDIKPNPEKALDLTAKLAEYAAPKLARTEVTGPEGGPVQIQSITRKIVSNS